MTQSVCHRKLKFISRYVLRLSRTVKSTTIGNDLGLVVTINKKRNRINEMKKEILFRLIEITMETYLM